MTRGKRSPRFLRLGHRLKAARKALGLNYTSLGKRALISRTAIQNIEEGRTLPGVDTVEKLADALGVAAAWLAYGALPKDPKEVQEE